jgi:hypothetical protein
MRGSIRERSPGHFAIILEQRDAATGKRKRKWHSFAGTKRQAQVECARLISAMKGGTYTEPNKVTMAVFLDSWLDYAKSQVSPRSHERYCDLVRKNIVPLLGGIILTNFIDGVHHRTGQRSEGRQGWPLAPHCPPHAPRVEAGPRAGGKMGDAKSQPM